MYEKVNPAHPDKIADRIAGAIVDLSYSLSPNPKVACEVLIGHGECYIINETSQALDTREILKIVTRISGNDFINLHYKEVPQDSHLAENQKDQIKCGDNGIFKGLPLTQEEKQLSQFTRDMYKIFGTDGKYIVDEKTSKKKLIICQSQLDTEDACELINCLTNEGYDVTINPLGYWTGGINVDSGATNRKLGSDMGEAVTGGGLHGKDLSKADVSVNIYAHLKAQELQQPIELYCAIGDTYIDNKPYSEIVEIARKYIQNIGGFEKFAEYGLI